MLSGEFKEGDHIIADVNDAGDGLALRVRDDAGTEGERAEELAGGV